MPGCLITGTDTGVGKTIVSCALAAALAERGIAVGVMKPVETGCQMTDGQLFPEDAVKLAQFSASSASIDEICPYRFEPPLAPSVAASMKGARVDPERILAVFLSLQKRYDLVLVEGAGGLLVPLVGRYTFADLALDLRIPAVVVVGSRLGALNHAQLTLHSLHSFSIPLLGYILNHPAPGEDEAIRTNADTLAQLTDDRCLGCLPHLSLSGDTERDRQVLAGAAADAIELDPFLRMTTMRNSK